MSTISCEFQNIEAYLDDEFIGYVQNVRSTGTTVTVKLIKSRKWKFPQRRAASMLRSARSAYCVLTEDNKKYYQRKDPIRFQMVDHYDGEINTRFK